MPGVMDIIAAFEHNDRVCQVLLWGIIGKSLCIDVAAIPCADISAIVR